ncbi:hypothetical protein Q7A53_05235 [Halobacillus rhizosphaerae]|uniref:hypothetical protein n=1 Tax=Halobacillus rhizosphaerae TaxID=3064889 RepID=UPI00398B0082
MKQIITLLLMSVLLLAGCTTPTPQDKPSVEESLETLNNAKTITVNEQPFSLSKEYVIEVDGKKVATVEGELIKMFGDKFTMKDTDGNIIIQEQEIKRFGRLSRSAVIQDKKGKTLGFIGEKTATKFTSIGYYFHFFDKNQKQIGVSDQINFSVMKKNNFMDNKGNVDYKVSKNFALTNSYDLEVKDTSNIPLYDAILMVCIEDAIASKDDE